VVQFVVSAAHDGAIGVRGFKDQSLNEWMTTKRIDEEIDEFRD